MKARAYYSEIEPFAAQWLRNLIAAGHLPPGDVDDRDIREVRAEDLRGYTSAHFFAGIGGWPYALRLAGWPDDVPVWTGSCPCQPFSSAGAGLGGDDPRHLWPAWFRLIRECRPDTVFGEQVEAAIAHGWLDLVCDDLEGEGYATGAVSLPACSVGAFHIRQRLWWVADTRCRELERGAVGGSADSSRQEAGRTGDAHLQAAGGSGPDGGLAESLYAERGPVDGRAEAHVQSGTRGQVHGMGDCDSAGLEGRGLPAGERASERSPWASSDFVWCRDGKYRPVEPGTFPLAHGVPTRVGRLRAYGNAIVPQVAEAFIRAYRDIRGR